MLSITFTCCRNIHILIRSPLKMKFLHLLRNFHGYIFNPEQTRLFNPEQARLFADWYGQGGAESAISVLMVQLI